jgi:hypothetical protein
MFMFIFIVCIALIVFTGLFLMRSNLDFIESKNKAYLKSINKVKPKIKKWNYYW